jgi:hypothetical protein
MQRRYLLASCRQLTVQDMVPASVIGFPRGGLGQEHASPIGFRTRFVHGSAHLLEPAFEQKPSIPVLVGYGFVPVRNGSGSLLLISHDRLMDGICSVVRAMGGSIRKHCAIIAPARGVGAAHNGVQNCELEHTPWSRYAPLMPR